MIAISCHKEAHMSSYFTPIIPAFLESPHYLLFPNYFGPLNSLLQLLTVEA